MSRDKNIWLGRVVTELHNVGHFLVDQGYYDRAIGCFEALSYGDETYENGDYAYGIGRAYEGKGDIETALKWYRIAYENNPPVPAFSEGIVRVEMLLKLRASQ